MTSRSRTRLAALGILLTLPLASAALPGVPAVPTPPALPDPDLSIREEGFTFTGRPESPRHIRVDGPEGTTVFEYLVDASGRAQVEVSGATVLTDATLVVVEGDPTAERFTLVLRDERAQLHRVEVDRAALADAEGVPREDVAPAIALVRPPTWPGAPSGRFLLSVEDSELNKLPAAALDGRGFLQRGGSHRVVLQVPVDEAPFDRLFVEARRASANASLDAVFSKVRETEDVAVFDAAFNPVNLGTLEGDTLRLRPVYERRLSPVAVERFAEDADYRYQVDGSGPTVTLLTPPSSNAFVFTVSWEGADVLSGLGGFTLDYREAGSGAWTRWLTKTAAKSASFSGDWDTTYEFRARAVDAVGNPSALTMRSTVVAAQPADDDDVNDPPSARLLTPRAGSPVAGATAVTWSASDPDGTTVMSKLEVSGDDGETWRVLYSGPATRAVWDTGADADGPGYRLRLTVSDGTQQASDSTSGLVVRNVVRPGATPPPAPEPDPAPAPVEAVAREDPPAVGVESEPAAGRAEAPGKRGVPAPFLVLALAGAALVARRRR